MLYLYVVKNNDGSFSIVRVITNPVNVRGNSGITYGDITRLDLATRIAEGFWTQEDVYDGQGEYMLFKEKVVTFDEELAVVTNTYTYELMPLVDIKSDLKNRVDSKRSEVLNSGFTYDGHVYATDQISVMNIIGAQVAILSDIDVITSDFVWRTMDDMNVQMDAAKFKAFTLALFAFTNTQYQTSWTIKAAIDAADTYEAIRTAATWDGIAL
jgi:hypothetical protein